MKRYSLVIVAITFFTISVESQSKPVIVVEAFTTAPGIELPYDLKTMQAQLVAELRVMLGKQHDVVSEPPPSSGASVYRLEGEITGWRPGNVAKRMFVGLGTGREASDIAYRLRDSSGKLMLEREDTIRTNFYSHGVGSTGTLVHPIAQKIADRIKNARLN